MLLRRSLSLYRVFDATPAHARLLSTSTRIPVTVGIRREDPQRIWERRAPLTPKAVKELVEGGVNVEIEHCDRRVFRDEEYIAVGAALTPTLSNAHIILGIKEPPLAEVLTNAVPAPSGSPNARLNDKIPRTHLMFSHTAKGQPYNTPLLAKFVARHEDALAPRLVDYELLTDETNGKRTVGFGWFAGVAGVLESLASTAQLHLENGIATPFLSTPRPHTHPSLQSIRTALKSISDRITHNGVPPALGPFVIGLTGTGNVAQGCLDILAELPIQKVDVKDLHALVTNPGTPLNKIYLVHALPGDYLTRLDGTPYSREAYYASPQSYRSSFCETIAPYLTLLLNGTGWAPGFPRLMTTAQLAVALDLARARGLPGWRWRFGSVGDVSCDIEGGLEFLTRSTTLSHPSYKITPPPLPSFSFSSSSSSPSTQRDVQMMAVDILPASLPLDASVHFSRVVAPYLWRLVGWYRGEREGASSFDEAGEARTKEGEVDASEAEKPDEEAAVYDRALARATIASGGTLVGKHTWLMRGLKEFWDSESERLKETDTNKVATCNNPSSSSGSNWDSFWSRLERKDTDEETPRARADRAWDSVIADSRGVASDSVSEQLKDTTQENDSTAEDNLAVPRDSSRSGSGASASASMQLKDADKIINLNPYEVLARCNDPHFASGSSSGLGGEERKDEILHTMLRAMCHARKPGRSGDSVIPESDSRGVAPASSSEQLEDTLRTQESASTAGDSDPESDKSADCGSRSPIIVPKTLRAAKQAARMMLRKRRVLMFGSGMVARPAVEEIAKREDVLLLVAGNTLAELEMLNKEFSNIQYRFIDVDDREAVGRLVEEADVVISLLPVFFHVQIARECLKYRKHLVTASYVSPQMQELHNEAVKSDVLLLNEVGLDPGIDHLSASDMIDRLKNKRKLIKSFTSFCGGLPAPDVEYTPLRYKFSWSPKGVLMAGFNRARYILGHRDIQIDRGLLFKNVFPDIPITNEFKLEGLANRDSISYMKPYMKGRIRTFLRGTLRYPGFSSLMESFRLLGFLNKTNKILPADWHSFLRLCIAQQLNIEDERIPLPPDALSRIISEENIPDLNSALEWLGLVPAPSTTYSVPPLPLPSAPMAPIDIFAYYLSHHLAYKPHERDMVVLSHEIIVGNPETLDDDVYRSSLITYGTPRASAMARTVGMPVAIAALLVLDGEIVLRGVVKPLDKSVYKPMLRRLEKAGLGMKETRESLRGRRSGAGRIVTVEDALEAGFRPRLETGIRALNAPITANGMESANGMEKERYRKQQGSRFSQLKEIKSLKEVLSKLIPVKRVVPHGVEGSMESANGTERETEKQASQFWEEALSESSVPVKFVVPHGVEGSVIEETLFSGSSHQRNDIGSRYGKEDQRRKVRDGKVLLRDLKKIHKEREKEWEKLMKKQSEKESDSDQWIQEDAQKGD